MTATINSFNERQVLLYENKFHVVTADLKRFRISQLDKMDETNSSLVAEFLFTQIREDNLKPASRSSTIDRLYQLSAFHKNKQFSKMTTEDIFSYLDSIRRTESQDPLQVRGLTNSLKY